jgi:TolB-like protein/DNA-binding winged helix-turn-helix (wHTH) protein
MNTDEPGSNEESFYVAGWQVRPTACEIARGSEVVKLEPKVMDLLQLLASRPGEVFTRIQLEEQVWPGLVIGYDALTKSVGKLREALGDTGKPPAFIQTIPKKGYRLIAVVSETTTASSETATQRPTRSTYKGLILTGVIVTALLIGVTLISLNIQKETTVSVERQYASGKSSLIVLPLKNLNADPQQDYFSRGITDDLITELSGYSGIDVISSRIAFQYQDPELDVRTLVDELGVRYVVEGSIRRTSEQIRINVQILDTKSGTNLWAEQYDRPPADLFDIQDEVRSKIISALAIQLSEAERKREQKRHTNNYRAYDFFLRGQSNLIKRVSAKDNFQAREYFEQAIAIDPRFSRAFAALAMVNADAYRHDWSDNPDTTARIALKQSEHARKLAPESRYTSLAMGYVQLFVSGNHEEAEKAAEHTLRVDPNNADANMLLATIYVHADEPDKAEAYVETSMRLNVNPSSIYQHIGALANLMRGDNSVAHDFLKNSLLVNPERLLGKIYMTIILVRLNRMEEALWYAEEIRATSPDFDAKKWSNKQPYKDRKVNQQLYEDLLQAGLN